MKILDLRYKANDELVLADTAELDGNLCFMWGGSWIPFEMYCKYRLLGNSIPPAAWSEEIPEQLDLF